MATVASETQVQQLYIAYFGRPADAEGLAFYADQLDAATTSVQDIADEFGASAEAAPIVALSAQDYVEAVYQQAFGRAFDAATDGTFWVDAINNNDTTKELALIEILLGATGADAIAVDNKVAVANTFTNAVTADGKAYVGAAAAAAAKSVLDGVTAEPATIVSGNIAAQAAVDNLADSVNPNPNPNPGSNFALTDGRDLVTGTDNDDTFFGDVGQNQNGAVANGFATGDVIDGGLGNDQIVATVVNDRHIDAFQTQPIHARTTNVEKISLEAVGASSVVVDAGRLNSVEEYWSDNSSVDLVIGDVRLGNLSITKDITFGLKETDAARDFTALIDSQSLTNEGAVVSNSQVLIQIADVSTETPDTPVLNVSVDLGFSLGGVAYNINNVTSADGSYEGLRSAIATAIDGLNDPALANISVGFGANYSSVTFAGNTVNLPFIAQEILVTDASGAEFSDVTFDYSAINPVPGGFLVAGTATPLDPTTSSSLIESNLVLDDAGRASTAGEVFIGGSSNSDKGVEQFNVAVDRDSAIESLGTSDDALQQVIVTSLSNNGDLEIGALDDNVDIFDANAFQGENLMLGTTVELADNAVNNLQNFNSTGAANNTLVATITEANGVDSDTQYSYNTGTGNDTFRVNIDGDAVDAEAEGFEINASSGDNTITTTLTSGVSQATMALLDNLDITTTSGTDNVTNIGIGNFDISVGNASDTVYIDSIDVRASTVAAKGTWTVGANTGPATFVDRVLYDAQLTVTFAGFESVVTVDTNTAGNYIANQLTINNAIKAAIAESPELSRLLTTTDVTGNEQLRIQSTHEGLDELAIDIFQPELVAAGATGTQVNFAATDLGSIQEGLIATTANDSAATDTVPEVLAILNAIDQNLDATGAGGAAVNGFSPSAAGGTADEETVVNSSTIDLGAGSNDLVILNSLDTNVNTLEFSANWGKVSVKNFFTDAAVGGTDGTHLLDFTAFLDDQTDASTAVIGDSLSAVRVATNIAAAASMDANSVTLTSFTVIDPIDGSTVNTFDNISDAEVLTALQADGTFGSVAASANLVGTTRDSLLFVENNTLTNPNLGEYKVYNVALAAVAGTDNTAITGVELIGTIDFGNSIAGTVGQFV